MEKSNKKSNINNPSKNRIVIITGASHGIGQAALELFQKRGDTVYDISRTSGTDITNHDAVRTAFEKIYAQHGRIDVLINNAGYGISGSVENTPPEDIAKMFAVNFIGLSSCCSAVLPYMRGQSSVMSQKSKHDLKKFGATPIIINISSLAAIFSLPYQSFYSASKSAVLGFTNALRIEIKPFKIRACSVLLGDVKTNFTAARKKSQINNPAYQSRLDKAMKKYEHDEQTGYSADFIAHKLYKLSHKKNPAPAHTFGFKCKLLVFLTRVFPNRFINWLVKKSY